MKALINNGKSNEDIARIYQDSSKVEKARQERSEKRKSQNIIHEDIVYATSSSKPGESFKIYLSTGKGKKRLLAERENRVNALCSHKGKLYDASQGDISETLLEDMNLINRRESSVTALCSHNGKLYDAGNNGCIYDTFAGIDGLVAQRLGPITALCSDDGTLYEAKGRAVYETLKNEKGVESRKIIRSLYLFQGELCLSTEHAHIISLHDNRIYVGKGNKIFDEGKMKLHVHAKADETITALGVWEQAK